MFFSVWDVTFTPNIKYQKLCECCTLCMKLVQIGYTGLLTIISTSTRISVGIRTGKANRKKPLCKISQAMLQNQLFDSRHCSVTDTFWSCSIDRAVNCVFTLSLNYVIAFGFGWAVTWFGNVAWHHLHCRINCVPSRVEQLSSPRYLLLPQHELFKSFNESALATNHTTFVKLMIS